MEYLIGLAVLGVVAYGVYHVWTRRNSATRGGGSGAGRNTGADKV